MATKVGRKQKPWVTTFDGRTIDGLTRMPDGRWRLIGTQIRFSEPDERKAIARFEALKRGEQVPTVYLQVPTENVAPVYRLDGQPRTHSIAEIPEAELFAWFAEQISERPKYVAAATGIEWIAYGPRLKPPETLPTFKELETVWDENCPSSDEQRRKVLHDWKDFVTTMKIASLAEITPQLAISYRDNVYARKWSGISQRNLFSRIRRLVSFAKSRAMAMDACEKALQALSLLTPSEAVVSLNPNPIAVADFKAILGKAEGDDKALVLLMLNCALKLQEAIDVRWTDIAGDCLVSHRNKMGRCVRVAVLWKETLDALSKIPRKTEYVFLAYHGEQLGIKGAELRFRNLREAAKVPHVVSSQFRSGALTAAAEANVTEALCKLLAGHRSGISDHYVKRTPKMVAPACDAIRAKYLA